jgi:hypothetical protein
VRNLMLFGTYNHHNTSRKEISIDAESLMKEVLISSYYTTLRQMICLIVFSMTITCSFVFSLPFYGKIIHFRINVSLICMNLLILLQ